ncbi:MAG: DUF2723 domain-containing protein [Anaerolineae bacterium]|nr:DUF2723 domain-containing protein [Anaerolineae bacterium]
MPTRRLAAVLAPVGVWLVAFIVYLQTLLPSVGWGDIARFQYVAKIWGVPHRFGYPLYIALSRLFGCLPTGDLAYRINLMSAFFAALAAVMVCLIVMRLTGDWLAGGSAGLSFAFSRALWGQAVVAEVYTLNAFLIGAVILVFLVWHQTRKVGYLYLGIGLYALSFGNHMTVVTLIPAVAYIILATDYRVMLDAKKVLIMAGLVLLGASQYLYVIVRAHQQPLLNELGPFSWGGWIHWMTRSRFEGQFFPFGLGDQVDRVRIYLELLEIQYFRWGYILGFIGAWERLKSGLKSFVFLALAALGIYVFGMNYGGITFRIYLVPSYLIFAVFLGCGLAATRQWLAGLLKVRSRWLAWPLMAGLAVVILAMPLYPLRQNWAKVDESGNTAFRDLARTFTEQVEPDFVVAESETHYDEIEAILYVAWGEKGWHSADTVTPGEIDTWLGRRPVYGWCGDVGIPARYIQELVPELPGMCRVVGVREG